MIGAIRIRTEIVEIFASLLAGPDFEDTMTGFGIAGKYRDMEPSSGERWLRSRGEPSFLDHGDLLHRVADDFRAEASERVKAYFHTTAGQMSRERAYAKIKATRQAKAKPKPVKADTCRTDRPECGNRYDSDEARRAARLESKRRWWALHGKMAHASKTEGT